MIARGIACALWIATSLAACAPDLSTEDGYYSCALDACPDIAPFCRSDRRCHRTPDAPDAGAHDGGATDASTLDASTVDASMLDAGPVDAGPVDAGTRVDARMPRDASMPSGYLPCNPQTCTRPLDECLGGGAAGTGAGYCAPPCSTTACPGAAGDWICAADDVCRVTCTSSADCPAGMPCLTGTFAGVRTSVCMEEALARPSALYGDCATDAECPEPLSCIHTACMRTCTGGGLCDEAAGEVCLPLPPPMNTTQACVVACPGTCPAQTECRPAGPGGMRCIPDTWPAPTP